MEVSTIMLRQVHPSFMDGEEPTSQAFVPFPKDKDKLSVDDGTKTSPEAAYTHYTTVLKLSSTGVWGISETDVVSTGLTSGPDPLPDNPAHALIDFMGLSGKEQRKKAKLLLAFALERGCLHKAA